MHILFFVVPHSDLELIVDVFVCFVCCNSQGRAWLRLTVFNLRPRMMGMTAEIIRYSSLSGPIYTAEQNLTNA